MALGAELEKFGTKEAMADDQKVADVYAKKGAKVSDLDEATVDKWRAIARDTAWKDYARQDARCRREAAQARRRRPASPDGRRRDVPRQRDASRPRRRRDRARRRRPRGAAGCAADARPRRDQPVMVVLRRRSRCSPRRSC